MSQAGDIVKGFVNLALGNEKELSKKRMAICKQCPFFKLNKTCQKCGCYMPAKTKVVQASCPIKKW